MKKLAFPLGLFIVSAAVMALTVFSGINGMYFFDLQIPYNYGYLLGAGFTSYSDIINPLTPLCGYLVLLGYKLFGLNYLSGVILAAILAAVQFILGVYLFGKVFPKTISVLFAFLTVLPGLPILGTIYYNNLILSYYALLISVFFTRLFYKNTNVLACLTWVIITITALTKLHIGVLFAAAASVIELNFIMGESKTLAKKVFIKTVAIRVVWCVAAPVLGALLLMCWIKWDIKNFLSCITMPIPKIYASLSIATKAKQILVGFAMLYALCLKGAIKDRNRQSLNLMLLSLLSLGILIAMYSTTPDQTSIIYMAFAILVPFYYYYFRNIIKIKNIQIKAIPLIGAAALSLLVIFSIFRGDRKTWNEDRQQFIKRMNVSEVKYPTGFFKGVKIREQQYKAISIIEEISAKYPQKKIFFGPSLELFYPATNRLPPQRWILWSHPGVSFAPDKMDGYLSQTFKENDYDIVFINPYRIFLYLYIFGDLYNYNRICFTKDLPWVAYLVKDENLIEDINTTYKKYYPQNNMKCDTVVSFFMKK